MILLARTKRLFIHCFQHSQVVVHVQALLCGVQKSCRLDLNRACRLNTQIDQEVEKFAFRLGTLSQKSHACARGQSIEHVIRAPAQLAGQRVCLPK